MKQTRRAHGQHSRASTRANAALATACGAAIPVTVDWDSFAPLFAASSEDGERRAAGYCTTVTDQMATMCKRLPEEQRTIAREIKSLTCRYSAAAGDHFALELQGDARQSAGTAGTAAYGSSIMPFWLWNTLD